MKKKIKGILALAIVVFIALFSSIIFSNSTDSRTCSNIFGDCSNSTTNDTCKNDCSGVEYDGTGPRVEEVYINATNFFTGDGINVTCQFNEVSGATSYEYIWYYNYSSWIKIANWTVTSGNAQGSGTNKSISFKLNSSENTHIVRCIISWGGSEVLDQCANGEGVYYDNDDVNFTVTNHLTYNFWNITNHTDGTALGSNNTYNRNDSEGNATYINISVNWSKNISFAQIEHNGNGSFVNYTICSPCSGTWTNYTLNLSSRTEFNKYNTTIKSIHVNDKYDLENSTSPELYFYLNSGIPPNVTNFNFYNLGGSITQANLFDGDVGIRANVSDDVGISSVIANITYPNGNSTNVSMTRESQDGQLENWIFLFNNTFPLNETGNFSAKIIAIDIGGQEKASGIVSEYENLTTYNDYTLAVISFHETYMRGENITIKAGGYNENPVSSANWTVNITKPDGNISNFTDQSTYFNYTIQPDDPEGNYSVFAYASKYCDNPECNSGNLTFEFNVSKNLTVYISPSDTSPARRQSIVINSSIYNARGELHTNASANISCRNNSYLETILPLNFTNGQASITCYAPDAYHYSFPIIINVSDDYNNTGQNYTVLTTESQTSSSIPSGSSGGFVNSSTSTKPKNCSDGTLYNQCSTKRPYYCSNGTLTQKCSICGCPNNTYNCQPAGYCILTKEEDFNFTLDITKIELTQGQDFDGKIGSLVNNGKNLLNLIAFINTSEDCCNISMSTNYILNEKEEKEVEMSMHVPLFTSDKIYLIKIGIGTPILKKERTIELTVKKSLYQNVITDYINEITNLENRIQTYKGSGVDTRSLEALVQQSKDSLKNANDSLSSDQADILVNSLTELKNNIESAKPVLSNMLLQGFLFRNSWLIALLVIFSLTTMYMVPQVLLPLNKKEKELSELKEEEKNLVATRIETEKQYFMRKIDENTFTKIMIGKQDKILRTRAAIKEKETERTKIIKSMSPISMFRWFGSSIKNTPKRILNRNNKTISEVNGKNQ